MDCAEPYQRRADLSLKLVERVKGYAMEQRGVLTQVTEVRQGQLDAATGAIGRESDDIIQAVGRSRGLERTRQATLGWRADTGRPACVT